MPSKRSASTDFTKRLATLRQKLGAMRTEEEVKAAWAKALAIDYDTSDDIDLYTQQVLFEFKHSGPLLQSGRCAAVLAQVMYYLRRLKLGHDRRPIPPRFAMIDRETVVISTVSEWSDVFSESEGRFDWDLAPSKADRRMAAILQGHPGIRRLQIFATERDAELEADLRTLDALFSPQAVLDFGNKKTITEDNFEDVFFHWNEVFGESVRNGFKSSRYFVNDIQRGRTQVIASQGCTSMALRARVNSRWASCSGACMKSARWRCRRSRSMSSTTRC